MTLRIKAFLQHTVLHTHTHKYTHLHERANDVIAIGAKIELTKRVQLLTKAIYFSLCANALEEGMNPSFLSH